MRLLWSPLIYNHTYLWFTRAPPLKIDFQILNSGWVNWEVGKQGWDKSDWWQTRIYPFDGSSAPAVDLAAHFVGSLTECAEYLQRLVNCHLAGTSDVLIRMTK